MKRIILLSVLVLVSVAKISWLSEVPSGFAWDEIDNSYQAYSLLKTGRDMFGRPLPTLLHSLADFKSSLYIYATVPFVHVLGPTVTAARMPSAIFGLIASVAILYIVGKKWGLDWGIAGAIVMTINPWWFHYSRLSFEAVAMLTFFLLGLALLPRKLTLASLMFALSIWSYSIAKFFIPIFILSLLVIYFPLLIRKKISVLFWAGLVLALVSLPPLWASFFGSGNTRFNEISIFTDPTTASEVRFAIEEGQVSSGVPREVGLTPRIVDRIAHNKVEYWANRFITNYLSDFSTQFLFTKGDPNLRHSPGSNSVGQFVVSDIVLLLLGGYFIVTSKTFDRRVKILLAVWIILAPIPAALTRDGAGHATRSLFLLPALVLIIIAGWRQLSIHKSLLGLQILASLYFAFVFGYHYFSHYRKESRPYFQWGYDQVVKIATDSSSTYQAVVVDTGDGSALMNYLASTSFDPAELQSLQPLQQQDYFPGISAFKFDNIYLLSPGSRNWQELTTSLPQNTLLIAPATSKIDLSVRDHISADGDPVFTVYSK